MIYIDIIIQMVEEDDCAAADFDDDGIDFEEGGIGGPAIGQINDTLLPRFEQEDVSDSDD